jgi:hypothetical protein
MALSTLSLAAGHVNFTFNLAGLFLFSFTSMQIIFHDRFLKEIRHDMPSFHTYNQVQALTASTHKVDIATPGHISCDNSSQSILKIL